MPVEQVRNCIQQELSQSACNAGYREMQRILQRRHNIKASRETVRKLLAEMDPVSSRRRRSRRFTRRVYYCKGPNQTWHVDGWDKLKPFGICVHGAIDGFSRKILWIVACCSNKDPRVIAGFYLDYVESSGRCPSALWSDAGTENGNIATMQSALSGNSTSHRYVTSVRNQRIECWWSYLMKARGQWWRDFFEDLCNSGFYNPGKYFAKNCLQYCFMALINTDLQETASLWNSHRIRRSRPTACPSGIPDELYLLPENVGAQDHGILVDRRVVQDMRSYSSVAHKCASPDIQEYLDHVMQQSQRALPQTPEDCVQLFLFLSSVSGE